MWFVWTFGIFAKLLFLRTPLKSILGLRQTGKKYREKIEQAVYSGDTVIIDFEGVESVSSSFADEFIAKLYISFGKDKFIHNIKFENVQDYKIKDIISLAIRDRLKESA